MAPDQQDVDRYQSLTPREHVLKRPAIYAGDCVTKEQDRAVFENGAVTVRAAHTNAGLQKLFDEALDNAVDNVYRDPPTTTVRVRMDATTFECANDGAHIPVQRKPDGTYVASSIFFKMFSGSNFNDEEGREAAGVGPIRPIHSNPPLDRWRRSTPIRRHEPSSQPAEQTTQSAATTT